MTALLILKGKCSFFSIVMENIHEKQVGEVLLPYQFEPEKGAEASNYSYESDSEGGSVLSSSEDEVDIEFERANAWRLETISWCKCGHCTLSMKAIECFCCHKKVVEYGVLLDYSITLHPDFRDNMLSEGVLKIDVCHMTSFHGNQKVEKFWLLISNISPKNESHSVLCSFLINF